MLDRNPVGSIVPHRSGVRHPNCVSTAAAYSESLWYGCLVPNIRYARTSGGLSDMT